MGEHTRVAAAALGASLAVLVPPAAVAQQMTVAPLVHSSIETRGGREEFSGGNLAVCRAGSPNDGSGFEAMIDTRPDRIVFRNGAIGLGAIGVIASKTRLDIILTNDTGAPLAL